MPECDHCNHHVTKQLHRTYSVEGELYACWNCVSTGHIDDAIRRRHPELSEPSQVGTTSPVQKSSVTVEEGP